MVGGTYQKETFSSEAVDRWRYVASTENQHPAGYDDVCDLEVNLMPDSVERFLARGWSLKLVCAVM